MAENLKKPKKLKERIHKRKNAKTRPRLAFSQSLRDARQLIAGTEPAAGLAALNNLAAAAEAAFADIQKLSPEALAAQGEIIVPARPPRLTVGLTKIANAFLQTGLTEEARGFLLKAIQLSPNGASRARQTLAKIALASDQPELAERYAREALLMGRFQAKTIAAWPLYLDARARQNKAPILESDVLASFRQHARGRIAGRKFPAVALLSIRHAAALGAMMATRYDIARQWLLALITEAAQLDQIAAWGRANWALARMGSKFILLARVR